MKSYRIALVFLHGQFSFPLVHFLAFARLDFVWERQRLEFEVSYILWVHFGASLDRAKTCPVPSAGCYWVLAIPFNSSFCHLNCPCLLQVILSILCFFPLLSSSRFWKYTTVPLFRFYIILHKLSLADNGGFVNVPI